MASAATRVSSTTNSSPGNVHNINANQNNGSNRTTMRSASNVKSGDAVRKQSPGDGTASRRPPTQKAWASGTNPITQRTPSSTHSNGIASQSKGSILPKMTMQKDDGLSDKHAHDRLVFVLGASIGLSLVIITKAGDRYEGILSGSQFNGGNTKITLKMTRKGQVGSPGQVNGFTSREAALTGSSPDHAINFDLRDVVDISIPEFNLPEPVKMTNGASSNFRTDADISGNQNRGERTLQPWIPDASDTTDFSLESGSKGNWDQFAANTQLFGAQSTYDENLYTTTIDRTAPSYKRREAEAARIAREIEGETAINAHIREERGQAAENDYEDEEDKYSGVRREHKAFHPLAVGGADKYTPPARRPPTGQPTVPGVPVDSAIISAQLSKPETSKQVNQEKDSDIANEKPELTSSLTDSNTTEQTGVTNASTSPQPNPTADGQTQDLQINLLNQFRQFADAEKAKHNERKKIRETQDRTAKINELLRFSKTFKLKTPVPTDLVGILAKDPVKQEAIIEKAQKEHVESTSATSSPAPGSSSTTPVRKFDASQVPPPIPDRSTFNRGRGGYPQMGVRTDRPGQVQAPFANRGATGPFPQRNASSQQPRPIPAPIPLVEGGRIPPTGPLAEQQPLSSPQRSNLNTPLSATSSKFPLNVKASEFRPNANAPTFNPVASSNPPSSPSSVARASSVSRAATPSSFFGTRKPKPASERPSLSDNFNPIKRMKAEVAAAKKNAEGGDHKDYSFNGGIPNAFQTGPRWIVKEENAEKTYGQAFERPMTSPVQSRASSAHHGPYQHQVSTIPTGPAGVPQISTPQHGHHAGPHQYPHQFDDGHQRMYMPVVTQGVYPSPNISSRQMSTYASPMVHSAQPAFGQQPVFGTPTAQMPIQMRQYPGTPNMMHAQANPIHATMMVQQPSNGPYMSVPPYNPQMPMYSPSAGHAYPQQNGYGSPGRMAPMMMPQGSQQGHHSQSMMYSMSSQTGPMGYPQPGHMGMPRAYGSHQYGTSPHQPYPMQQRTMSSGYGQVPPKMMQQQQQQQVASNQGPPINAPQQPAAFAQVEGGQEEGK